MNIIWHVLNEKKRIFTSKGLLLFSIFVCLSIFAQYDQYKKLKSRCMRVNLSKDDWSRIEHTRIHIYIFINMSTYIDRFDSYQRREYANVFEVLVYLQHDMIMLKVIQHELNVMEDLDESRQYEAELNKEKG